MVPTDTMNRLLSFQLSAFAFGMATKEGMHIKQPILCQSVIPTTLTILGNTAICNTATITPDTRKTCESAEDEGR